MGAKPVRHADPSRHPITGPLSNPSRDRETPLRHCDEAIEKQPRKQSRGPSAPNDSAHYGLFKTDAAMMAPCSVKAQGKTRENLVGRGDHNL